MPHFRKRAVLTLYQKLIKATSILGVFGHRQVGKTTFIHELAKKYLTFDSIQTRKEVEQDPENFLHQSQKHPLALDECQNIPSLFPSIKEHVRKNPKKGQFILSGSVRFTSRKAIRESLAGRMLSIELYPLTLSEIEERELPDFYPRLFEIEDFEKFHPTQESNSVLLHRKKNYETFLKQGGLPGICFYREEHIRTQIYFDLLRLILDRDLRIVHETKVSLEQLQLLLQEIARTNWAGYSASNIKRATGISFNTLKQLIYAFESIFLLRRIPIFGGKKGNIFLLEDQMEEFLLSGKSMNELDGMTSAIYRNCRAQFFYRMGNPVSFSSYWTRNNARVPLVLESERKFVGIVPIHEDRPSLSQIRAADSFLKSVNHSKVIFVTTSLVKPSVLDSRKLIVSVYQTI